MNQEKAKIQQEAAAWLRSRGYDRRVWKDVSEIIADWEVDKKRKEEINHDGLQFQVPAPNLEHKLQRLADGHKDYLDDKDDDIRI